LERELVSAAKRGDETAFARLIEAEAPRVYRAVLAVVRSPQDAQEVIQDASVRAWRQLHSLRDEGRFPAWYRQIAVRVAIDTAGRKKHRVREIELDPDAFDARDGVAKPDPSTGWDERLAVLEALSNLPADDRAILGLRYGADLEVPDVAATLGIPLGTAKSRLHRALSRLAAAMEVDDGDR
jgi:RNA polymerase sigma factor (sigma-70 family)